MATDILACNVRQEDLEPVWLTVENQDLLGGVTRIAKSLAAEVLAKFERHIEPRKLGGAIQLDSTYVVNAKP